ncbi:ferrochelatase [Bdellovibrionota bacterium FG-1]
MDASLKKALLLINLGTPDAPTPEKVKKYLAEFLMDPYVIDISAPLRWLLVHGIILRTRPKKSARLYQKIWTDAGSPLLLHLYALVDKVQERLDLGATGGWKVVSAMRYGQPSIERALLRIQSEGIRQVSVWPLYPQYSLAATESSCEAVRQIARRVAPGLELSFRREFYDDALFLDAFAAVARQDRRSFNFDHLLMSFHGLPERQVKKTDSSGAHCLVGQACCEKIIESNRNCYRAQCFATARALASRLELAPDQYSIGFQSRLGRTPWIQPYTEQMYSQLAARGVKRLAVMCPAFVADCLETLEEIKIRGEDMFRRAGGEQLHLIPSLNSSDLWADALTQMVLKDRDGGGA